jgi:hypothetical protein
MEAVASLIEGIPSAGYPFFSAYWLPTLSVTAPFTYTSTSIPSSQYFRIGKFIAFMVTFSGTAGGTLGGIIDFTLPVTSNGANIASAVYITDGGIVVGGTAQSISATQMRVRKFGAAAYTAGTVGATVYGFYEAA